MICNIITGTWDFYLDRGCRGSHLRYSVTFNSDGTFNFATGGEGVWSQINGLVMLLFDSGAKPAYTANVAGSVMTGGFVFPQNQSGCWYATQGLPINDSAQVQDQTSPSQLE